MMVEMVEFVYSMVEKVKYLLFYIYVKFLKTIVLIFANFIILL